VKITPAHDFNDFEVGRRHSLPMVNILDAEANVRLRGNEAFLNGVPPSTELAQTIEALDALDRFTARASVVAMLEERELIEKTVEHTHMVPHGDRSGVPIEPFLTDQWYVDAKTLAGPAIESVQAGRTIIVPKQPWEKTYFDWMENIQPWCISRQLWWGHRIPAWYGPDGEIFVEETEEEAEAAAYHHYGVRQKLERDEDVLDTWFSSALWPFSTLGWPEETPELKRYYPTSALVTGFDIIFFWVARMLMMGIHFMGDVPFRTAYIHGIVRDEKGAKMSKSKGNVIDPLDLMDEFGADALRFTMAALATPRGDVKPSRGRLEGYRAFANKIWNAARFCEMNGCRAPTKFEPRHAREMVNRWILSEAAGAARATTDAIESFRFNEAAEAVYHFVWDRFCDWYLELIKPLLAEGSEATKAETRAVAGYVLDIILRILHPFMPYITEALWTEFGAGKGTVLALSRWPSPDFADNAAAAEINWLVELVAGIRSVRSEMNLSPAIKTPLVLIGDPPGLAARLAAHRLAIERMARVDGIATAERAPPGSAQIVVAGATAALPLAGIIDFAAEEARLEKEIARVAGEIGRIDKKLANEKFVSRAPEEVVEAEREKRAAYAADSERLAAALRRITEPT
jgi:valyl-tRNA synthetase